MTLRHLRIFVAVFQNSSVTRAARELHLAQPSVSFALRELEGYYGIRLFDRIGRGIVPTEAGKEFYSYAVHITGLFGEMEQKMRNWDTMGVLRVGSSITIGTHILPGLIRSCRRLYPDLTVEARVNQSAYIERCILDNSIDIGLIETFPSHPDIAAEPFMEDEMCAIAAPFHPLAQETGLTPARLAGYPLLMREKGSAGREILDAWFALEHLSVRPLWESSSTQAIVKAVSEGLGIAVLPYLLVEKDIREGQVSRLFLEHPPRRTFNLIYHKNKYLTENMLSFLELCRKGSF